MTMRIRLKRSPVVAAVLWLWAGLLGSGCDGGELVQEEPPLCPYGIESELPLVLEGETVPGNLELGLASAPETSRNPCGSKEEQICFLRANDERALHGLEPYIWDGDLADLGRSHAFDRTQQDYGGNSMHGSSTNNNHLYQERAEWLGLKDGKFVSVVENSGWGYRTGESVVDGWMSSSGHRAVILGEGHWSSLTHMACGFDGHNNWNMEFGE